MGDYSGKVLSGLGQGAVEDGFTRLGADGLRCLVRDTCGLLREAGIAPHEPVIVPVSNRCADVAAILSIQEAGGVPVPLHRRAHANSLTRLLDAVGARFALELTPDASSNLPVRGAGLVRLQEALPPERPLLQDAGIITFTSGSTGVPKGVVLSAARAAAKLDAIGRQLDFPSAAVTLVPLQLTFSFGQWATFLTLSRGGTVHLRDRLDPADAAELIARAGVTHLAAVPTLLRMLPSPPPGSTGTLSQILTGGEPVTAGLRRQILSFWPRCEIVSIFGLTETGTSDFYHFDSGEEVDDDSLGRIAPDERFRIDPVSGELLISTPFAMLGYLDNPESTAQIMSSGWVRTGDLALDLGDGRVQLVGRSKDLINRAGNKIAPLEIERLFAGHPGLSAVLVTGAADPRVGEAVHLMCVPRPGAVPTAEALHEWAKSRIERFKLPDRIHFAAELPIGGTGKADRAVLRRRIEAGEL